MLIRVETTYRDQLCKTEGATDFSEAWNLDNEICDYGRPPTHTTAMFRGSTSIGGSELN